jgi:exosortase/archaeosortase family protein
MAAAPPRSGIRLMPVRIAIAVMLAVCWDAWRLLAGRIEDAAGAATILVLVAGLAWRTWSMDAGRRIAAPKVAGMLALYAAASWIGPALLQIGAAVVAITVLLRPGETWRASLPVAGFALLSPPILPTLDFLLAYPLRRVSVLITAGLLRMNGMAVGVEGVALDWHGQRLLFDGPCSGVKMLWAALLLASLIALAQGATLARYLRLLGVAIMAAVGGNALRAASLFYLENGFVAPLRGGIAHEAVGVVAFLMLTLAILAGARQVDRRFA